MRSLAWGLIQYNWCLYQRGNLDTEMCWLWAHCSQVEKWTPCEHWSYAALNQGSTRGWSGAWDTFFSAPSEGSGPCWHLDFWLPASRTVRQKDLWFKPPNMWYFVMAALAKHHLTDWLPVMLILLPSLPMTKTKGFWVKWVSAMAHWAEWPAVSSPGHCAICDYVKLLSELVTVPPQLLSGESAPATREESHM